MEQNLYKHIELKMPNELLQQITNDKQSVHNTQVIKSTMQFLIKVLGQHFFNGNDHLTSQLERHDTCWIEALTSFLATKDTKSPEVIALGHLMAYLNNSEDADKILIPELPIFHKHHLPCSLKRVITLAILAAKGHSDCSGNKNIYSTDMKVYRSAVITRLHSIVDVITKHCSAGTETVNATQLALDLINNIDAQYPNTPTKPAFTNIQVCLPILTK